MSRAILRGCLAQRGRAPDRLAATDVSAEARAQVAQLGVRTFTNNVEACAWADTIVLAVKPQVLPQLLAEIADHVAADKLVISIAAGVTTRRIREGLNGHARLVRAMPNMPAVVAAGATAIASATGATEADLDEAAALFQSVGSVVRVSEAMLDAVTGLSGSGPAYAFIAIEALADAGVRAGLPRDVALKLAAQTLMGAGKMVLESGEHPGKLKDMVTSPAGTTIAGVAALERAGFRAALMQAVEAATARSKELGE